MVKLGQIMSMATAGVLLAAAPLFAAQNQSDNQGAGRAVITIMPAKNSEAPANLNQQDLTARVNGKDATITNWAPLRGDNDPIELVLMIDAGARTSLTTQFGDIQNFVKTLPSNVKVTLAYMENGVAQLSGPLTTDRDAALKGLHIPVGLPGEDASPYFCLSDLAKHWPSSDRQARREVVMITDGVDYYNPRFDPQDPYMEASIRDSLRAGIVVYSIYWENRGRFDRTGYANNAGQNLLLEVTQATGGNSYWEGIGNPVSFKPYFQDLDRRLQNQYELSLTAPVKNNKPGVEDFKLKVTGISGKVDAPQQIYLRPQS